MEDDDYIPQGPRERRLSKPGPPRRRGPSAAPPPRKPRPETSETRKLLNRAFNGDTSGTPFGSIGHLVRTLSKSQVAAARDLLFMLERRQSPLLHAFPHPLVRLATFHTHYVRKPGDFTPDPTDAPSVQFHRLCAHLFEKYPIPDWLLTAWTHDDDPPRHWYVHLGAGKNLTTASHLPFPLTKRMAHIATTETPESLRPSQALRYAQCRALEIPNELALEIIDTRLSSPLPDEPFWLEVLQFFARNPEVFGHASTIVDYLFAHRIGDFAAPLEPDIRILRRSPDRVLADAQRWHQQLRDRRTAAHHSIPLSWPKSRLRDFFPTPDAPPMQPPVYPPMYPPKSLPIPRLRHTSHSTTPPGASSSSPPTNSSLPKATPSTTASALTPVSPRAATPPSSRCAGATRTCSSPSSPSKSACPIAS